MRCLLLNLFCLFTALVSCTAHAAVDMSQSRGDVLSYVGSFKQSIPIAVAPGRAGMQPALMLNYSSSMPNSLYGYGWNLDVTRIERDTRLGVPKYAGGDTYLLVMKGARQALIDVGGGEFRVANENSFLKILKTRVGWVIRDQNNTLYALAAPWPKTGARQFSWSLSHVEDVNGNVMDYTYADGGSGHRLQAITYPPANRVDFMYESRPDQLVSYRSGLRSDTTVRLSGVKSYTKGGRLTSHISFGYAQPSATESRSLLTKATVHDVDGLLPARSTSFSYTLQEKSVRDGGRVALPYSSYRDNNSIWKQTTWISTDVNGDGVMETATGVLWRGNKRFSFTPPFTLPSAGIKSYTYRQYSSYHTVSTLNQVPVNLRYHNATPSFYERAIVDMNGDGYMDWVYRDGSGVWRIYFHNGSALSSTYEAWNDTSGHAGGHALYDVNGDGLPDLLYSSYPTGRNWMAYLNTGKGFTTQGISVYLITSPIPSYMLAWGTSYGGSGMDGYIPAILTSQKWNTTPLMTAVRDEASGLKKTVTYALQGGIANAPALKLWLVKNVSTQASNVEMRSSFYSYSGGLYVPSKMEFRGFGVVDQNDVQTGITTTTTYAQDLIFQGRPTGVTTSLNGATLSSSTTSWAAHAYNAGKRHL